MRADSSTVFTLWFVHDGGAQVGVAPETPALGAMHGHRESAPGAFKAEAPERIEHGLTRKDVARPRRHGVEGWMRRAQGWWQGWWRVGWYAGTRGAGGANGHDG